MGALLTYSANTSDTFLSTLKSQFDREDVIHVVSKPKDYNGESGFILSTPIVTEIRPGLISIQDVFTPGSYNIQYGDSMSIFKSGVRRTLTVYNSRMKLLVDKNAVKNDIDNAIKEVTENEIVLEIKEIPGKLPILSLFDIMAKAVRRVLLENAPITDYMYDVTTSKKPWMTNIYESPRLDKEYLISKEDQFIIFVIYRVSTMLQLSGKIDEIIHPVYRFNINPIYGMDSSISIDVNLCQPLSEKRPFSMSDIQISARHKSSTLTNPKLRALAHLFSDCIPD